MSHIIQKKSSEEILKSLIEEGKNSPVMANWKLTIFLNDLTKEYKSR